MTSDSTSKLRVARRNLELVVGSGHRVDALLGRLLGEDQADAAAVRAGLAVGGVVHLEHEIGAGLHQLGLAGAQDAGRHSGSETHQQLGRAAVVVIAAVLALLACSLSLTGTKGMPGWASFIHFEPGGRTNAMM